MKVINFFDSDNKERWLEEIKRSDWGAGQYLYELLRKGELKQLCGDSTKVLLLVQGDELISFCTYAEQDDVRESSLTPWVGFVYTFPEYRGNRCVGKLLEYAYAQAKTEGCRHIYISTGETGLYEKYGYVFWKMMKEINGEDSRVYRIDIVQTAHSNVLRLRPYKESDAGVIISWCKDEESFRKWTSDRYESFPITARDMNQKYIGNNGDCGETDNFYPVTAFDDQGIVGHLIMRYTDQKKETLRLGFVIVDDSKRGKGYGKEMIRLSLKYAFEIFKAKAVTIGVFENNPSAYYCYRSAGFQEVSSEVVRVMGEDWKCIEMRIEGYAEKMQ